MNSYRKTQNQADDSNRSSQFDERYIHVIQQEGAKTRKTIWIVAIVALAVLILSPLLLAISPILALILGIAFLSALMGAFIGKSISRKREQHILNEVTHRNERNIVAMQEKSSD